jgi:hypothetical protein
MNDVFVVSGLVGLNWCGREVRPGCNESILLG